MSKKIFFVLPLVVLGLIVIVLLNRCIECEYTKRFLEVEGVASVDKFSQYEDHLSAEVTLNDGGFLDIGELSEDVFQETHYLLLFKIGDIRVRCLNEDGNWTTTGFNLIHFVNNYTDLKKIHNISDVVFHYDSIYKKLDDFLKIKPDDTQPLLLPPKNKEFEARKLWCYRKA